MHTASRANQLFEDLVQGVDAILWEMDPSTWCFTFVNEHATKLLGYPVAAWLGEAHFWENVILHPDDRAWATEYCRAAIADHRDHELEYRAVAADGRVVWLRDRARAAVDAETGKPVMRGVMVDVTAQRQTEADLEASEARYRLLVEASPDIIVVHCEGRLAFINPAGARLIGASHPDELVGRSILDFVHPDSRASTTARIKRVLETGEIEEVSEEKFIRLDGTLAYGDVTATRTVFNGAPASQVVIRDVTRRHETEEALRASKSQLQQAQKMEAVGRLAGGVAHDFNNLLTAIIGNARLVLDDLDPESRLCEDIRAILSSAERAAEVTRQLLAFSRKQVLLPRVINLNDVVAQMDLILRRLIGENIQLITELNVVRPVRADPGQISQVVLNLVVNARDAIGDEGFVRMRTADVELAAAKHHLLGEVPPGSYVTLTVSDTGGGIKEADLQNIFEPFFTTKPEGKGTGLGLATVYGVVRQSGGYLGVDSKPDTGTKFTLYFPSISEISD